MAEPRPDGNPLAEFFRPLEQAVAPGVRAVIRREGDTQVVIWVRAERPGSGAVGRWLDGLATSRKVKVIGVEDERLAAMLERRGFRSCVVPTPGCDEWVPAYVRSARS